MAIKTAYILSHASEENSLYIVACQRGARDPLVRPQVEARLLPIQNFLKETNRTFDSPFLLLPIQF